MDVVIPEDMRKVLGVGQRRTFHREALNTLDASWWTLRLARLFGRKVVGSDGMNRITCYSWRGKTFLVNYQALRLEAEVAHLPQRNGTVIEPLYHTRYPRRRAMAGLMRRDKA